MKTTSKLTLSIFLVLFLIGSSFYTPQAVRGEPLPFPSVKLYIDGSFLPDEQFLLSSAIEIPSEVREKMRNPLLGFDDGFEFVPENSLDVGVHKVIRTDGNWRVYFTIALDAPLIDIWDHDSTNERNDRNIKLNDEADNVRLVPPEDAQTDFDMGLSFIYGSESFLLENSTDTEFTGSWNYTTDFAVSNYDILAIENLVASSHSSNVTVTVSYVEDLSYTDLSSTYAYNVTLFNDVLTKQKNYWWRLDLENTNSSFDAYVANIEVSNFESDGRFILSTNADVKDNRYVSMYVGKLDNPVNLLHASDRFTYKIDRGEVSESSNLKLNSIPFGLTLGEIMSKPSELMEKKTEVKTEARGWLTAKDLENDIEEQIVNQLGGELHLNGLFDGISDLSLSDAIMGWSSGGGSDRQGRLDAIVNDAINNADDGDTFLDYISDNGYPSLLVGGDGAIGLLSDGFSLAGNAVNDAFDGTFGFVGGILEGAGDAAMDVFDAVGDIPGEIGNGLASIVSAPFGAIGDFFLQAAPFIAIGLVGLLGVFLLVRFLSSRADAAGAAI